MAGGTSRKGSGRGGPAGVQQLRGGGARAAGRTFPRPRLLAAAVYSCLVLAALPRPTAAQDDDDVFVCPTDKPEEPYKDGDMMTYYCCRQPRWDNDWCYHDSCVAGLGCTANNKTECPDLSDCLCFQRIGYTTRSSCSLVQSCEQARQDMSLAKSKILEMTNFRVDELDGCQRGR